MPCGTLHYTPPEVLRRSYTNKCDMWSLGVITYMLLIGRPPFQDKTNQRIVKRIMHEEPWTDSGRWRDLSLAAKDFVKKMLTKSAVDRPDAAQALEHEWLKGEGDAGVGPLAGDLGSEVLASLRKFAHGSHLRRAA